VFLIDAGDVLFVWVGSGTTKKEKANAISYAALYLKHHGRPYGTPISRVVEGSENASFWKHFS